MTKRLDLKTFKLTEGDITFNEQKDIDLVSGVDEVAQAITSTINQNLEAWFLNVLYGVKNKIIQAKKVSDNELYEAVRDALNQEERIKRIENFEVSTKERTRYINFTVILIDETEIEVTL